RPIVGLDDSKRLPPGTRERLSREIRERALAWGVAWATVREIDQRGIEWANRIAFSRAVRALLRRVPQVPPGRLEVYLDGTRRALRLGLPQVTVARGDRTHAALAAGRLLAKTAGDRFVLETMHARHPQYGLGQHKGHATARHREALRAWGPCPYHRMSFRPLAEASGGE